jgi:anti-sigma factor RsiW
VSIVRSCDEIVDDLQLYVDSECDVDTAVAVAAHLDVCPACAEEVATYRWLKSALRRQRTIDRDAVGRLCAFAALLTRGCQ